MINRIPLFQIDAFANKLFVGNPGAVCPLLEWLPDSTMQKIAAENNLSETAFYVKQEDGFSIRWFTPNSEINLCGHGTVAMAHVLWNHLGYKEEFIKLFSKGGELRVTKDEDKIVLNFPSLPLSPLATNPSISQIFGENIKELYETGNKALLVVLKDASDVIKYKLDRDLVLKLPYRIVYITAKGVDCDFVSRVFAPAMQIDEDPVTGSAHCAMVPYWASQLGKKKLYAQQLSERKGHLWCEDLGDRVLMAGHATTYLVGEIWLDDNNINNQQ